MSDENERLLTPLQAAHHLGITTELLFQFTKRNFGKTRGLRPLQTVEYEGQTRFSVVELDAFDSMLDRPWCDRTEDRPSIPRAILDHLRAESQNQCARCGSGIGVDTAHIRPWAISRSHHPHNLIRVCSACHREHDVQHSLSADQLQAIKDRLIARTRANLMERMQPRGKHLRPPRASHNFVGRENELEVLVDALRSGRSVTVYGVGGIGKSELLLQALSRCDTGRSVLWCNIEQYRTATDVISALRTALSTDGMACSNEDLPSRLDATHACVVFDGIEQGSLDDIEGLEDAVNELFQATSDTQFVSTSQVLLHRLPSEARLNVRGLGQEASQTLLDQSCGSDSTVNYGDADELLKFCDGHALTIKLAGALTLHYGSATAALEAIHQSGIQSVSLPGRSRHTRATSLELCLHTAYEALSNSSRKLLWALALAPAGVWTHYIERGWRELDAVVETLASLRKWHLVDVVLVNEQLSRTRVLAPVRRFVIERGKEEDLQAFEQMIRKVVQKFGMMVAFLELNYDTLEDTPYVLQRFGDDLANYLHILKLAQERQEDEEIVRTALSIVQSLMRYFFVLRLLEQGTQVMLEATDLAFRTGRLEKAIRLVMQFLALAQRSGDGELLTKGLTISNKISSTSKNPEVLADAAMCQAIVAQCTNDFPRAEQNAREAFEGYRSSLLSLKDKTDEDGSLEFKRKELHNDVANALVILGFSLLSQQEFENAAKAYSHSLQHERGASIGVNRGQTLHQIGNCESNLGNHESAAKHYIEAAKIFHFIGMEEYLSNAFGELGYTLLDIDYAEVIDDLNDNIVDHALADLNKDVTRVFDPIAPLDHQQCIAIIRKLFGTVVLLSLTGYGSKLTDICVELKTDIVTKIADQIENGARDKDEKFPVVMIDTALYFGVLIAQCENDMKQTGDVDRDVIGEILRMACEANNWAQTTMRVLDWVAVYLDRRLQFKEITVGRIHEFASNYRDDIEDYLDLVR